MGDDTNNPACTCWPAKADFADFPAQVDEVITFLRGNELELRRLRTFAGVETPHWTLESNDGTLPCNVIGCRPNCSDWRARLTWTSSCRSTRQAIQVQRGLIYVRVSTGEQTET